MLRESSFHQMWLWLYSNWFKTDLHHLASLPGLISWRNCEQAWGYTLKNTVSLLLVERQTVNFSFYDSRKRLSYNHAQDETLTSQNGLLPSKFVDLLTSTTCCYQLLRCCNHCMAFKWCQMFELDSFFRGDPYPRQDPTPNNCPNWGWGCS